MDFEQPEYLDDFFKQNPYSFRFKKSFFFFDSMVICLGSNIYKKGLETKNVVTTLFQNKLIGSSKVQMNLGEKKMEFDKSHHINNQRHYYIIHCEQYISINKF